MVLRFQTRFERDLYDIFIKMLNIREPESFNKNSIIFHIKHRANFIRSQRNYEFHPYFVLFHPKNRAIRYKREYAPIVLRFVVLESSSTAEASG